MRDGFAGAVPVMALSGVPLRRWRPARRPQEGGEMSRVRLDTAICLRRLRHGSEFHMAAPEAECRPVEEPLSQLPIAEGGVRRRQ